MMRVVLLLLRCIYSSLLWCTAPFVIIYPASTDALTLVPKVYNFDNLGRPVTVFQHEKKKGKKKIREDELGFHVWTCGEVMAYLIATENLLPDLLLESDEDNNDNDPSSTTTAATVVVELGCGVGLPGITAAAVCGDGPSTTKVILTDYTDDLLEAASEGILASGVSDRCKCRVLDWQDLASAGSFQAALKKRNRQDALDDDDLRDLGNIRYLLASDCVYSNESSKMLAAAVSVLATPGVTEFVAITGSKSFRKGVDGFQKELERVSGAKSITMQTLRRPPTFFNVPDDDGNMPFAEPMDSDVDMFCLWRVQF